jgi:hypothetical protein
MSPQYRQRAAGVALSALFAAAPLLAAEPAWADPTESGHEVVFDGDGGLLGLGCAASPSTPAVTLPAESTLRVVNRTGRQADLKLDGKSRGMLADQGSTQVVFHRGPVELTLEPTCMLGGDDPAPVTVTVSPTATAAAVPPPLPPAPTPTPTAITSVSPVPDGAGIPPVNGITKPRATAAPTSTVAPRSAAGRVAARKAAAEGTAKAAAAKVPGMPLGDGAVLTASAPALDVVTSPTVLPAVPAAAAEPVAALAPLNDTRPVGLLAIIATVCAAGVGAGAIRAITAQRANRATIA